MRSPSSGHSGSASRVAAGGALAWPALAGLGVALLVEPWTDTSSIDALGLIAAAGGGATWALYMVLAARPGQLLAAVDGLALAMSVAALAWLSVAAPHLASLPADGLLVAFAVAVGATALTFSLETLAVKRLALRTAGVL